MERISTWEAALGEYIASMRDVPFEYGTNDCCTFISGAVEAMCGVDPMPEFRGKYDSLKTSIKALREIGEGDLSTTLDTKFVEAPIASLRRGDVALFGDSAGVVMGTFAWFVSDDGLERVPLSYWEKGWRVG